MRLLLLTAVGFEEGTLVLLIGMVVVMMMVTRLVVARHHFRRAGIAVLSGQVRLQVCLPVQVALVFELMLHLLVTRPLLNEWHWGELIVVICCSCCCETNCLIVVI